MSSPLSNIPGIGGLFGGGKEAKEKKQDLHFALDKAHQAALMAEEVQQTYSLIERLGDTPTLGIISEITGIQRDVALLERQLKGIFDDDFGSGDIASDVRYKTRQVERALKRLEEIHESAEEYGEEQVIIRDGTSKTLGAVRGETGILGATQGVAEIGSMNVAATQNNSRLLSDILAIEAARESRDMEDRMLAKLRACKINEDSQVFQRDHCS